MVVSFKGLQAVGDAHAVDEHNTLYLISLTGPREAVRGILAGWAKGENIYLGVQQARPPWRDKSFLVERVGPGVYHGLGYVKGYYFARQEDPYQERLWASRQVEIPIPEGAWALLRPKILLGGRGVIGLRPPSRYEIKEILHKIQEELCTA